MKVFTLRNRLKIFLFVFISILFFVQPSLSSDPDTIMARHFRALGGIGKVKYIRDVKIDMTGSVMGIPSNIVIRGIYPDSFELSIKNESFEVVWFKSPKGEFLKTADGTVRSLSGLDSGGFYALSSIFNYAYINDMSLPLIPESEVDPKVFTMDTGANFGTKITLDPDTYLIKTIEMETGRGGLVIYFYDYKAMDGINFPARILFSADTDMELIVKDFRVNEGLKPSDFIPPAEGAAPLFPPGTDTIDLNLGLENGHVTFTSSVNNSNTKFVLNSGWGDLPLFGEKVADVAGEKFPYRGGLAEVEAEVGGVSEISIGNSSGFGEKGHFTIYSPVLITDKIEDISGIGKNFDALIGYTLFARAPVGLDIRRGRLSIYNRDRFSPPEDAKKIRLVIDGGIPLVAGKLDGKFGMWVLDTGYPGFGYVTPENISGQSPDVGEGDVSKTCNADSINVGGLVFEGVDLDVLEPPKSYPSQILGALGVEFLKEFFVIFDYRGEIAYFVPHKEGN